MVRRISQLTIRTGITLVVVGYAVYFVSPLIDNLINEFRKAHDEH